MNVKVARNGTSLLELEDVRIEDLRVRVLGHDEKKLSRIVAPLSDLRCEEFL